MRLIISQTSGERWGYLEPGTADEIAALERSAAAGQWTIGRGDAAITRLRTLAEQLGYRAAEVQEPPTMPPRRVVVQRGETGLVARLRELIPSSVPVIADRRARDRRAGGQPVAIDRRRRDRRQAPSAPWGALRFVVAPARGDSV